MVLKIVNGIFLNLIYIILRQMINLPSAFIILLSLLSIEFLIFIKTSKRKKIILFFLVICFTLINLYIYKYIYYTNIFYLYIEGILLSELFILVGIIKWNKNKKETIVLMLFLFIMLILIRTKPVNIIDDINKLQIDNFYRNIENIYK